jgi:hypothetical protein
MHAKCMMVLLGILAKGTQVQATNFVISSKFTHTFIQSHPEFN